MSKTIADLDINFTFENYIPTIEYLYEFAKENRHLINLEIKPGTYTFQIKNDCSDPDEFELVRILVKCKMPLYNLIGRLNNIIFGLKEESYSIGQIIRFSDYSYDLYLIKMPF
jgi:hypothetical protein